MAATERQVPKRLFRNEESLSVIGFGGILCLGLSRRGSADLVAEVCDRGINYFDVAPSYGDGEAEEKLGPALEPHRARVFLACKTMERDAAGSRMELERSLRRLRTDWFDLYQFHAVTTGEDVERIFGAGGALETVLKAREQGLIRHIGFSAHSESAALEMFARFPFDSVLFPFNAVCAEEGNFGPRVLERAGACGAARLALKALASSPWPSAGEHPFPKCWYRPIEDPELAQLALRYTLGMDITATVPPGDETLFRFALEGAAEFTPLSEAERDELLRRIHGVTPLFRS